ncbi:pentatricopeptide repeat-containing protein At2g01510, mitochondrial [Aristolochia californica]|uniref:pentatricopeptide repeat-containing protein At2g01510, mitochondrial n=1 Tax=Aristolochia californica TaxID=171875 RepID=UPI0035D54965
MVFVLFTRHETPLGLRVVYLTMQAQWHFLASFCTCSSSDAPQLPSFEKEHFVSILRRSRSIRQLEKIHGLLLTTGYSRKNSLLTELLEALVQLKEMPYAQQLFDEMRKPRTYLWNIVIRGYVRSELYVVALEIYRLMHRAGSRPDNFTFPFVIKACTQLDAVWGGPDVHALIVKLGLEFDTIVRTELMIMYAKFGNSTSADYLFDTTGNKDLIFWNALVAVYQQSGRADKALDLFRRMKDDGLVPDSVTLACVLSCCAFTGSLEVGTQIDRQIVEQSLKRNVFVDNALLDMYAKCGSMEMAEKVFLEMPVRNVVSWSTMIGGYAINGESRTALVLFSEMQKEGVRPNHVTFLSVLSACSHAGLINEGRYYFNLLAKSDNFRPRLEHYACMVDLFARSGHLEEAYNFIKCMPIKPDAGVWGALLGACTIYQNLELGQQVADQLIRLAPDASSYHVLISNIYASAGRWEDVVLVRKRIKEKCVKKVASYSSVELNGKIHVFNRAERSHPQSAFIYKLLEELLKDARSKGYTPKTRVVLHDVEEEEKESVLGTHSEKLAIAFGLINLPSSFPIRVIKNLRICSDCHTFSKFVSGIVGREIIIRDKIRFHHFKNGVCSCRDFW